jgi:hypothetical protein
VTSRPTKGLLGRSVSSATRCCAHRPTRAAYPCPGSTTPTPARRTPAVEGVDMTGAPVRVPAMGQPARRLQHKIDHVHGLLFLERMAMREVMSTDWSDRC